MNSEWKQYTLSQIGKIITGKTPPTNDKSNYHGDIPFLTPSDDLTGKYVLKTQRKLSSKGAEKVKNSILPSNTICVSCIGSDLGKVVITTASTVTNQQFNSIIVDTESFDVDFVYYALVLLGQKLNYLSKTSTAVPIVNKTMFSQQTISCPDLKTQRVIGRVLSILDNKIQTNNLLNDNLAKQAMLIYQQLLGTNTLSKGHLRDIATITMGQSPSGSSYNEDGIGTVFYQGRTDFGFRFPTRRLYTTEPKKIAAKKDVLLSVRAPVGDINVANESCCIGRGLSALRSLYNTPSFLYYTMVSLRPRLDQFNGEGTVFGSVSQDSLNNLPIYIPPVDQIASFEATVAPLDAMIMNNNEEIMRLTELRDYLLPRLLNGQISIGV